MKNAALLNNKLFDKEEKAFALLQKLSEIHGIRHNTMNIKSVDIRKLRCEILNKKEDSILKELDRINSECNIIKEQLKLLAEEEIECVN